jgi:hypothetical protein
MIEENEEFIEVLYNYCYGGFNPSEKAKELYIEKMLEIDKDFNNEHFNMSFVDRDDQILIEIFHQLGVEKFSGTYSRVKSQKIPKKFKDCFDISEYDGKESVNINYIKYKLDRIRDILKNKEFLHLFSFQTPIFPKHKLEQYKDNSIRNYK